MSPKANKQQIGEFILNNDATYDWIVYPEVPGKNGARVKVKIGATFKHVTPERRVEVLEEYRKLVKERAKRRDRDEPAPVDEDESQGSGVDDVEAVKQALGFEGSLLSEVLIGFKYVRDPQGQPVEFNDETKAALLANSWARGALFRGYIKSLSDRDDAGN
ncbi:MAG: hypothetical protein HYV17_08060 [Xanthomonadales bacterium]|nr:hypothetical protein [Xanthomonadales bacterium]